MKKLLILIVAFNLFLNCYSQDEEYLKIFLRMEELNGTDFSYQNIFKQLKASKPNLNDSSWSLIKTNVYDPQLKILYLKLAEIYTKYFSLKDLKEIIAFYESPVGKKLSEKTPILLNENSVMLRKWSMDLIKNIDDYINKEGLDKKPFGIENLHLNK